MLELHGFGPRLGLADASPFVLKIDAYLRMASIPFKRTDGIENMRSAPKGKLPYISEGGKVTADSGFIMQHLQQKYAVHLDDQLSEEQQAIAYVLTSTLEEKLYWCGLYFRWVEDAGWSQVKAVFFADLPMPLKLFVPAMVRRGTRDALLKQGIGRHSPEEILSIARDAFSSVSTLIGTGPFLFGDSPCSADATLYGFLAQSTLAELDTPVNAVAKEFPNLQAYCEHFRDTYYSDS